MNRAASRLSWLNDGLSEVAHKGLWRQRRTVVHKPGGRIEVDGKTLFDFSSNDYLGLASHPRVVDAAIAALQSRRLGAAASPLVTGRTDHHAALERSLASFEEAEDAILFPTGYAANIGVIGALIADSDIVFCDRLNHASLVEGCKLSGATFRVYRSDQLNALEKRLSQSRGYSKRWIVTDGVFSMDGKLAPLDRLCEIANKYDAALIVDEAHGTGVLGDHGRGACEQLKVEDQVSVRVGTLSKAVGALGGFVAGPQMLTEYLWHHAKSQMYSTALPAVTCAAATAAIEQIKNDAQTRQELREKSRRLREQLVSAGLHVPSEPGLPIVPVIIGGPTDAVEVGRELERLGFLVSVIRPPTVPRGTARLRISISAAHDESIIQSLADHVIHLCRLFATARQPMETSSTEP